MRPCRMSWGRCVMRPGRHSARTSFGQGILRPGRPTARASSGQDVLRPERHAARASWHHIPNDSKNDSVSLEVGQRELAVPAGGWCSALIATTHPRAARTGPSGGCDAPAPGRWPAPASSTRPAHTPGMSPPHCSLPLLPGAAQGRTAAPSQPPPPPFHFPGGRRRPLAAPRVGGHAPGGPSPGSAQGLAVRWCSPPPRGTWKDATNYLLLTSEMGARSWFRVPAFLAFKERGNAPFSKVLGNAHVLRNAGAHIFYRNAEHEKIGTLVSCSCGVN